MLTSVQAEMVIKKMMEEHITLTYKLAEQSGVLETLTELIRQGVNTDGDLEKVLEMWKSGRLLLVFPENAPIGMIGFKIIH